MKKLFVLLFSIAMTMALIPNFAMAQSENPTTEAPIASTETPAVPSETPAVPTETPVEPTQGTGDSTAEPGDTTPLPGVTPPDTGAISIIGLGTIAAATGAGIVLFRKKQD